MHGAGRKAESQRWKAIQELNSEYKGYGWPNRSAEAEKQSFKLQCDKHITEYRIPTQREIEASNSRILPQYLKHNLPEYLLKYNRTRWSEAIDQLLTFVKAEASPGVPHAMIANRNDDFLAATGERFHSIVLNRIEALLSLDLDAIRTMNRKERLDYNLMDPVRVFVKNEPHKVQKLDEGRVRLIMSVSLTDKMIEMLLSRHICKLEIQNWLDIPSKPGIGFTSEANQAVYEDVTQCGLDMSYADVSGWDWGVKEWQILDEAESLISLSNQHSEDWNHLLRAKAILEAESVYQFSDGEMVAPNFKGIVNSGKLRTSRGNSWMRVRVADLIGSQKTIAAGDDSVENTVADAPRKYLEFGIRCKDYLPVDRTFEFCSRIYGDGFSYPVNKAKMVMNLLHHEPKTFMEYKLLMIGFEDEMRDHPEYQQTLSELEKVGWYEVEGPHYTF